MADLDDIEGAIDEVRAAVARVETAIKESDSLLSGRRNFMLHRHISECIRHIKIQLLAEDILNFDIAFNLRTTLPYSLRKVENPRMSAIQKKVILERLNDSFTCLHLF